MDSPLVRERFLPSPRLEALRHQKRSKAVKELLLALRNNPDGNLLRCQRAVKTSHPWPKSTHPPDKCQRS